jgi:hypothetical protein
MKRLILLALGVALLVAAPTFAAVPNAGAGAVGPSVGAAMPALYVKCANYNRKFPHGLGRAGASDETKSTTSEPVTNFRRSTKLYKLAMTYNKGLDRDKDGVACEKH